GLEEDPLRLGSEDELPDRRAFAQSDDDELSFVLDGQFVESPGQVVLVVGLEHLDLDVGFLAEVDDSLDLVLTDLGRSSAGTSSLRVDHDGSARPQFGLREPRTQSSLTLGSRKVANENRHDSQYIDRCPKHSFRSHLKDTRLNVRCRNSPPASPGRPIIPRRQSATEPPANPGRRPPERS